MARKAPTFPKKPHGLAWAIGAVLAALAIVLLIFVVVFYNE